MISLLLFGGEGPIPCVPFPRGEGEGNKKRGCAPLGHPEMGRGIKDV
jgi:hypothetical protein